MSNSIGKAIATAVLESVIWHATAHLVGEVWRHSPTTVKVAALAAVAFLVVGAIIGSPYVMTAGVALGSAALLAGIICAIYANTRERKIA
jgi:hypothetical protein